MRASRILRNHPGNSTVERLRSVISCAFWSDSGRLRFSAAIATNENSRTVHHHRPEADGGYKPPEPPNQQKRSELFRRLDVSDEDYQSPRRRRAIRRLLTRNSSVARRIADLLAGSRRDVSMSSRAQTADRACDFARQGDAQTDLAAHSASEHAIVRIRSLGHVPGSPINLGAIPVPQSGDLQ